MFRVYIIAISLVLFQGCEKAGPISEKDPAKSFKPIAEKFIPALNAYYKEAADNLTIVNEVSVSEKEIPGNLAGPSFDVKKTDSLLSPFVGEIRTGGIVKYQSEAVGVQIGSFVFHFAWQDDKWVPQGGQFSAGGFKVPAEVMKAAMDKAGI